MQVLVVDDLNEIVELVEFYLQTYYPQAQIFKANDGQEAIAQIVKNPQLSLVISDLNMPIKNGADVYTELRKRQPLTPFILLSTTSYLEVLQLKNATLISQIPKPFSTDELIAAVQAALSETTSTQNTTEVPSHFIPINTQILKKIRDVNEHLFLKLSDNRFVKILNAGSHFGEEEVRRFEAKKIEELWVKAQSFSNLFEQYKKQVFFRDSMQKLDSIQVSEELALDHSMVNSMARNFGWSKDVVELTTKTIDNVIKMLEQTPDLNALLASFKKNKKSRLSSHAVELSALCVAILKNLNWGSKLAIEKAVFVSIVHDMELNEELFETKVKMLTHIGSNAFANAKTDEFKIIQGHAEKIASALSSWANCPPDVDSIIRQHHERPDGTGFPKGLKALEIAPISAVIILAEDLLFNTRQTINIDPFDYLISKKDYYNHGEFRNIHSSAMKVFEVAKSYK